MATHPIFEWCAMALVFGNAVVAGCSADYVAQSPGEDPPAEYRYVDLVFLALFILEVAIRLVGHRGQFFTMGGWAWNVYDLILCGVQCIEELLLFVQWSGAGQSNGVLRLIRTMRSLRAVRALRIMRFTEDLQVLVSSITHSMRTFAWTLSLLLLFIYVAANYVTQAVSQARSKDGMPEDLAEALKYWYGSVLLSVLSLFQALTGGVDWNDVVRPLFDEVSWATGLVITTFLAFSLLVIMNIFTGVFVDSALSRMKTVREERRMRSARAMLEQMDWIRLGRSLWNRSHIITTSRRCRHFS